MERRAKYGNRRVSLDGYEFDSRAESRRYEELRLLQKAGEIGHLVVHPVYEIAPGATLSGRRKPPLRYEADFEYMDTNGQRVVEDVKSDATRRNPTYRLKLHLMATVRGIQVREVINS